MEPALPAFWLPNCNPTVASKLKKSPDAWSKAPDHPVEDAESKAPNQRPRIFWLTSRWIECAGAGSKEPDRIELRWIKGARSKVPKRAESNTGGKPLGQKSKEYWKKPKKLKENCFYYSKLRLGYQEEFLYTMHHRVYDCNQKSKTHWQAPLATSIQYSRSP